MSDSNIDTKQTEQEQEVKQEAGEEQIQAQSDESQDIISLANLKDTEEFVIDEQLKGFLFTMSPRAFMAFEKQILEEGCQDDLVICELEGKKVLIDGHHRLAICQKHNLPYGIREMPFNNREQIIDWMIMNQKNRRNMTLFLWAETIIVKYKPILAAEAKKRQQAGGGSGSGSVRQKSHEPTTLQKLADRIGLSTDSIRKIEYILHNAGEAIKDALRRGDPKISVGSVFTALKELEKKMEDEDKPTPRPRQNRKASSVPIASEVEAKIEGEFNAILEYFKEMEAHVLIEEGFAIYDKVIKWAKDRQIELVAELSGGG